VSRPAILAIDGGGSKIDAALVSKGGRVLGGARWHGSTYDSSDRVGALEGVSAAVKAVCADAGIDGDRVPVADLGVFCLAGADLPSDDRRIAKALAKRAFAAKDLVLNDTFAVMRAGTDRSWGVAVVCGFGTNCSGVAPDGKVFRFPAVGSVSGDWGGGTDVGGMGLWFSLRARDGRGQKTTLAKLVPAHFGMRTPRQVMEAMYFGRMNDERVVELAPIVFRAAIDGDEVARCIVDRQADEVVAMAGTAIRRLRMTKMDVDVVLGGGIFRNGDDAFFERIDGGLRAVAPAVRITRLTAPPVVGAVLLGLDLLGAGKAAASRLRPVLTHERLTSQNLVERKE
jgi:N-acetylglucosamine kinase-like BadF-type ATPase